MIEYSSDLIFLGAPTTSDVPHRYIWNIGCGTGMPLMASKVEVRRPALPIRFHPSFSVEILQRSIPDFLFRHEKPGRMQRTDITSLLTVQVRISSHVNVGECSESESEVLQPRNTSTFPSRWTR